MIHKIVLVVCLTVLLSGCSSKKDSVVTIGFCGDVMLGRLVGETIANKPYTYVWGNVLPLLQGHDLNVANLETTLTKSTGAVPKVFNYKSDPRNVRALVEGNIQVVNLANNHILDFGVEGLKDTLHSLNSAGILHVGAGMNLVEARKPVIVERNGLKIGIIGFTDNEPGWAANDQQPGVNYFNVSQLQKVQYEITQLKPRVDVVIVSLHWGGNWATAPSHEFQAFARALVHSGVNIIHGHSAHIPQGIEMYNDALIMYSTGDFVDDYAVDPAPELRNDRSFLFVVQCTATGVQRLQLVPVIIKDMQVTIADGVDAVESLQLMINRSLQMGTQLSADGVWQK